MADSTLRPPFAAATATPSQAESESKALQGQGIAKQRMAIVDGLKESVGMQSSRPEDVAELLLVTQYIGSDIVSIPRRDSSFPEGRLHRPPTRHVLHSTWYLVPMLAYWLLIGACNPLPCQISRLFPPLFFVLQVFRHAREDLGLQDEHHLHPA